MRNRIKKWMCVGLALVVAGGFLGIATVKTEAATNRKTVYVITGVKQVQMLGKRIIDRRAFSYAYNKKGLIKQKTTFYFKPDNTIKEPVSELYSYDRKNRHEAVYLFAPIGNQIQNSFLYDKKGHVLANGMNFYKYNPEGKVIKSNGRKLKYGKNKLPKKLKMAGRTVDFTYDEKGNWKSAYEKRVLGLTRSIRLRINTKAIGWLNRW